ncbi:unnamed protein product, partial [Heterosigma akashiwo]
ATAIIAFFEDCKKQNEGFDYHCFYGDNGAITGMMWMDGNQRYLLHRYGHVLGVDSKRGGTNIEGWPYMGWTVIDQENKIHQVFHGVWVGELMDTYKSVTRVLMKWVPRLKNNLKVVNSDQFLEDDCLTPICPSIVLHRLDDWHMDQNLSTACGKAAGFTDISKEFKALRETTSATDFERRYNKFVLDHRGTSAEEFVQRVYEFKNRWAHFHTHQYFNVGKNGSGHTESGHSIIANWLVSLVSLNDLVGRLIEFQEHRNSLHQQTLDKLNMERSMDQLCGLEQSTFCTKNFIKNLTEAREFYDVVNAMGDEAEGVLYVYVLRKKQRLESARKVVWNSETGKWECPCLNDKLWGWPCRHILCILEWDGQSAYCRVYFHPHW